MFNPTYTYDPKFAFKGVKAKEKVEIAEKLDEIGVDRIEAGMPAVSEQDFEAIKQISKLGLKSKIYTFARAIGSKG